MLNVRINLIKLKKINTTPLKQYRNTAQTQLIASFGISRKFNLIRANLFPIYTIVYLEVRFPTAINMTAISDC